MLIKRSIPKQIMFLKVRPLFQFFFKYKKSGGPIKIGKSPNGM